MADLAETCEDLNYDELTLVQKRNWNIERNRNFFLTLFGSSSSKVSTVIDCHTSEKRSDISRINVGRDKLDSLICDEERRRDDILTTLSVYYPHRRDVIQNLAGYLNPVSVLLA
jgi:hypothetical protein